MMQDSSTGTSKTNRANLVLQKVVHIMKGNFGLSVKKLQYEALQDQVEYHESWVFFNKSTYFLQNEETPRKLSYSTQLLEMMLNSHHSFKNKVGTALHNVQTQMKETVNVRYNEMLLSYYPEMILVQVDKSKMSSYRPRKRKTICLRCGNNVTNVSSVTAEVPPCECGDNHDCQCQVAIKYVY